MNAMSQLLQAYLPLVIFIGIVLFLISLAVNVAASSVVFRAKQRAERILS